MPKKAPKQAVVVVKEPSPTPVILKRKKVKRGSLKIYLRRLCKNLKIPSLSKEGYVVMTSGLDFLMKGVTTTMNKLLQNNPKKILNVKTTELAFISFLNSRGVDLGTLRELLAAGRASVAALATLP